MLGPKAMEASKTRAEEMVFPHETQDVASNFIIPSAPGTSAPNTIVSKVFGIGLEGLKWSKYILRRFLEPHRPIHRVHRLYEMFEQGQPTGTSTCSLEPE